MMASDIVQQLRETFLFRGLPGEVLAVLAQKVVMHRLVEGDVLMRKGEKGESLFMIHHGWVKIVAEDSHGGELVINKCGPGETIGEMALLDRAPRSAGAIALEEAMVIELKQDDFYQLLDERPDLAIAMINGISSRLRFSTTYIEKVVEWSRKIAAGDYSFIEDAATIPKRSGSDEDKASTLLSAFFQMVKQIKEREDGLKHQVEKLTFEVDHARRKQEFEAIASTEFYARLKEKAKELRRRRLQEGDQGEEAK